MIYWPLSRQSSVSVEGSIFPGCAGSGGAGSKGSGSGSKGAVPKEPSGATPAPDGIFAAREGKREGKREVRFAAAAPRTLPVKENPAVSLLHGPGLPGLVFLGFPAREDLFCLFGALAKTSLAAGVLSGGISTAIKPGGIEL